MCRYACTLLKHKNVSNTLYINIVVGSEVEIPHGMRRAESCDSVASDSSVLEMSPDMPKIGQMEFALEYDRYIFVRTNQGKMKRIESIIIL